MKQILTFSLLSLIIVIGYAQTKTSSIPSNEFETAVNVPGVQVLDVRTLAEYNSGHLKKSLQADWYNQQQFKDRTSHLDKAKPVYVYCLTGVRSAEAVKMLRQTGFTNVHDLQGGINAWKQAGKPVEGAVKVKQVTLKEYMAMVQSSKPVLVDFGAEWCPPCKKMQPVIEQLKKEAGDKYKVVNIDAATQTEILKQMNIEALPVFIVYKNGKEVWRKQGVATQEELASKL